MFLKKSAAVSKAVNPIIEALEDRRLMSATLTLKNLDGLPFNNRLIFNKIQNPDPTFGNTTHDTAFLQLQNTGDAPLTISTITPHGPWTIIQNLTSTTIAPGGSGTIELQFTQTRLPSHSVNETNFTNNKNGGAAITDSLVINSNDPAAPTANVTLAGYWQSQSEHNAEPNLTTITNLLGGFGTTISSPYSVDLTEGTGAGSTPTYYGDEFQNTTNADWAAANTALPVTIRQLAAFHTEGNVVHTYWYTGNTSSQFSHSLLTSLPTEGQTLLPHASGGGALQASFKPSGAFGFRVDNEFSNDAVNVAHGLSTGGGHHFRFYPVKDSSGNVEPNTWLVAMDYSVLQTENFDFQDNVFIVSNMRPNTIPPAPANFTATNGAAPVLTWSAVTYPTLAGYNLYRATSPAGPFTTPINGGTPIAGTSFTDSGAPAGPLYYQLAAVDSASHVESSRVSASANPNQAPIANPDAFDVDAGVSATVNVLANDTDISGSLDPTKVLLVSSPAHGTATVDPVTGEVTYTSTAGFSGTDTFSYTVRDSNNNTSAPATITFTVTNVQNANPLASNGSVEELAAAAFTIPLPQPTNSVGDPITPASVAIVTQGTHGTAAFNPDGTFTYTVDPNVGANFVGSDSFTYNFVDTNGKTSNTATISLNVGVTISSVKGATSKSITYTDAGGAVATITLNKGQANVFFGGGSGAFSAGKGGKGIVVTLTGGLVISDVVASNTTAASVLSLKTAGNKGIVTLQGLSDAGILGKFIAKNANLDGTIDTTTINVAGLGTLQLASANTSIIRLGNLFAPGTTILTGAVTDSLINSTGAIKSLKAASWTNTDNANQAISAPSIGVMTISGDFDPNLILSGSSTALPTLGTAKVLGHLGAGEWDITGNARSITAGTATTSWAANVSGTLSALTIKSGGLASDVNAGALGNMSILGGGALTSVVTAANAKTIKVTGALTGATLNLTGAGTTLKSLIATGGISASTITTGGDILSIVAASLTDSTIDAGTTATLASATLANLGGATLRSIRLTAKPGVAFSNSQIVAHTITSASIGVVSTSNGGTTEGLGAAAYKTVSATVNGAKSVFSLKQLVPPGLTFGDFVIKIINA